MIRIWMKLAKGNFIWKYLRVRYHIDATTVVLFLSEDNSKINEYAIKYLDDVMGRKGCKKAVIFTESEELAQLATERVSTKKAVRVAKLDVDTIMCVYDWYRVIRFNRNVFFTFTDRTKDNLLGRFLRETDIDENDAVCLAIYNFRYVLGK